MSDMIEQYKIKLRQHSRFPYTFACDWIRSAGLAESRSDASKWRNEYAEKNGITDDEAAVLFAEDYITHQAILEYADDMKVKLLSPLLPLLRPNPTTQIEREP